MPSNVADRVYSMRVVGDDLWVGTYQGGNIDVSIYNQSLDSDVTPYTDLGGYAYPADIEICEGIVHVAFGRLQWWQGGYVARYDTRIQTEMELLVSGQMLEDGKGWTTRTPEPWPVMIATQCCT